MPFPSTADSLSSPPYLALPYMPLLFNVVYLEYDYDANMIQC